MESRSARQVPGEREAAPTGGQGDDRTEDTCPLTDAQVRLLQAAAEIGSTCSKDLARAMGISSHTVDTEWRGVMERLSVHDRGSAGMRALASGWISSESDEQGERRLPGRAPG